MKKQAAADYAYVVRVSQKAFAEVAGPSRPWSAASLTAAKERLRGEQRWIDTAVLVDRRPAASTMKVVVSPASGGVSRLQLRGASLSPKLIGWMGEQMLRRAWVGFVP